ncbi:MAG: protein kinase domain-containing protein [Candidatus Competibacteraceae bacterium]
MSQSADSHPALTVRDDPLATRRDVVDATVRDDALPSPTLMHLPPTLAGRYRIVQPLPTAGGEADLLLVEAVADRQQQYIVKIYRYGIVVKPEVLARISAAAPDQVIHLVEYGQADGHGYEVLEYVAAGSLRPWLMAGPLADGQVRALVQELSLALAVLHQHDVLHRDIKPENVLIRQWEPLRIALTDFGIASVAEATQHFTTTARTLRYAAPEAATGVIGVAADYWSLGMVALEAVSGRHPFAGLSEAVLSYQLVTQPVDCSGVAEPWRTLCRGLLLRDPKQRWGRAEIARWLAGDESLRLSVADRPVNEARAQRPYRLGQEECWTARELAVQMARHWEAASKDLGRGFISDWLRTELHDQDLARAALDVLDNSAMSADERLLRVLVKMAPDLPPVWKQWSLAKEDLIAAANQANQGDEACRGLLSDLYQREVLGIYAEAGNAECQRMQKDWQTTVNDYEKTWQTALEDNNLLAKFQPDLVVVLPSLLLAAVSPKFQNEIQTEIQAMVLESPDCPVWLNELLVSSQPNGAVLAIKIVIPALLKTLNELISKHYHHNNNGSLSPISSSELTDADLIYLQNLPHLKSLDLQCCESLTDTGFVHLRDLTNLQSLDLGDCKNLTDAGLAHLRNLTNLQSLYLWSCENLTGAGLAHLQNLTNLQSLCLSGCENLTDAGLAYLQNFTSLKSLDLDDCKNLTDAGLAHLQNLTNLQSLDLRGCENLTDAGLAHLQNLTNLQLYLGVCENLTDAGLAHLQNLTNLQSLCLSGCENLTGAGLAHLCNLTNLQSLNLDNCSSLTDAGLAYLRNLTNLQRLHLRGCENLTDAGLAHLQSIKSLQSLFLGCTKITNTGLEELRKKLPNIKIT